MFPYITGKHWHFMDPNICVIFREGTYKGIKAGETAVIGRLDASKLNFMIDVITERHDLHTGLIAKQG